MPAWPCKVLSKGELGRKTGVAPASDPPLTSLPLFVAFDLVTSSQISLGRRLREGAPVVPVASREESPMEKAQQGCEMAPQTGHSLPCLRSIPGPRWWKVGTSSCKVFSDLYTHACAHTHMHTRACARTHTEHNFNNEKKADSAGRRQTPREKSTVAYSQKARQGRGVRREEE